jgi:hypothetical protein
MAFPYFEQVTRAYEELLEEGEIKERTVQEEVEQDKGLLTRRAGYYVNREDDPDIGILKKETGNNSQGYSVDLLIHKNGTFWDVATDVKGLASPVNGGPSGPDPELSANGWTEPTADLANLEESEEGGYDLTKDAPPYDEAKSVQFGTACNDVYTESKASPDGGMIAVHSFRCSYDYYVKGIPWDECYQKHVNAFRLEYGLPPL